MKSNNCFMAWASIFFAGTLAVTASMEEGATVKKWKANPARHVIELKRATADETAKRMINLAEKTGPALKRADTAVPMPDPGITNWWCESRCGVKIPYAITEDAIAYYENMIRANQKKDWEAYIEPGSSCMYTAGVSYKKTWQHEDTTFSNVYVVTLELQFNADFTGDATTGVHFTKSRTVVIDKAGTVIAVYGDGKTEAPVVAL
jgi:hypothetical protein